MLRTEASVPETTAAAHSGRAASPADCAPEPKLAPVVFRGRGTYLATGRHTREVYQFTASTPKQLVDAADVEGLINTGLFSETD